MTVSCRMETADDQPFLRQLIIETVSEELGAQTWPEPLRSQLLELQYRARRSGAGPGLPGRASQILVADDEDAGWLLVAESDDEIRIVEIMVASPKRRSGIGSAAIATVLARAARERKPVRLLVTATNAGAIRLYRRLGFRQMGDDPVQHAMEWIPDRDR